MDGGLCIIFQITDYDNVTDWRINITNQFVKVKVKVNVDLYSASS